MNVEEIEEFMAEITAGSMENRVGESSAIKPELASMRMYDRVLAGVASADDRYWDICRESSVVGPHFMAPRDWLASAASIVSIFFSLTQEVVRSNAPSTGRPSDEWLHARYEGQFFIESAMTSLMNEIISRGHEALFPQLDPRFESARAPEPDKCAGLSYTSNWSERHAAFACGLGTFGLSAGIITKNGMAGRLGSLITSLRLEPALRGYTQPFEYCTGCAVCAARCPAGAISKTVGKDHQLCAKFINKTKLEFAPRLGCGKCQTAVPCQTALPKC